MDFALYPWRFCFVATEPVHFPAGKAGNVLRGAFGSIFRQIACTPGCESAAACSARFTCPYARIFEPRAGQGKPSGLHDLPRPFVFRAFHLDGRTIRDGEPFHFDVHVFDVRDPALAYFILTFAQLVREGLGPRRGKARLLSVWQLDAEGRPHLCLYEAERFCASDMHDALLVSLRRPDQAVERLLVRFVSPVELKGDNRIAETPEFPVLFGRVRDRVCTLRSLYGAGALQLDFREMGHMASKVTMTRCDIRQVAAERLSSRTGQAHGIGGFIGEAEYRGEMTAFVAFLKAAQWTGVGRHTVWGKGHILVDY